MEIVGCDHIPAVNDKCLAVIFVLEDFFADGVTKNQMIFYARHIRCLCSSSPKGLKALPGDRFLPHPLTIPPSFPGTTSADSLTPSPG